MEEKSYPFLKPQPIRQQFNPEFQANPRKNSKSCSHFLLKFLLIALFLCVIPLFPANPPEFISETVFAKSWELFHLLVIGIALSYGLFCRRKIPEQVSPKSHISQQYRANILHHASLFDCKDENPSGNFDESVKEKESCDFSYYRTEPYVVVRKENGEKIVERSLGLPVRSLRSRVVESDSEEERVSEAESDFSGESSCSESSRVSKSEKGEILVGNVGGGVDPNGWTSRSMGAGFMAGNGGFGLHGGKDENFGGDLGVDASLNGWNSRSMRAGYMAGNGEFGLHGGEGENFEGNGGCNTSLNGWKSRSMRAGYMAESGNVEIGSGNGENLEGNVGTSSPVTWKSESLRQDLMVNGGAFGSELSKSRSFRSAVQGEAYCGMNAGFCSWLPPDSPEMVEGNSWGGLSYGMPLSNCHNQATAETNFFMPSTANPPAMTVSTDEIASAPRMHNYESGSWGVLPNFEKGNLCIEKSSFYMPPAAVPPSNASAAAPSFIPAAAAPSFIPSAATPFTASAAIPPFVPSAAAPQFIPSATVPPFIPSAEVPSSMPPPGNNFGSSSKESKQSRMIHTTPVKKDEFRPQGANVGCFSDSFSRVIDQVSLRSPLKDVDKPITGSTLKRDEDSFTPQTPEVLPSIPGASGGLRTSVRASRRSKLNRKLSANKDEQTLEKDISVEKFAEGDIFTASHVPNPISMPAPKDGVSSPISGSIPKSDDFVMSTAPTNDETSLGSILNNKDSSVTQGGVMPSTPSPAKDFASSAKKPRSVRQKRGPSLKKDQVKPEKNNENPGEGISSHGPHSDPLPVPTTEHEGASSAHGSLLKKNEQKPMPMKWDEDCFVIPSLENLDTEDIVDVVKEDPTPDLANPSEVASSSTDAYSSRMSCDEQGLQQNGVEEDVQLRASTDNSTIEDFSKEIEAYRPSTPSPPPRLQIRANDDVPSSVESSSRALAIGCLLNEHDDQGSPPTPKRGKALSRSHSRGFSCTSFFDRDLRRSYRNEAREESSKSEGDQYAGKAGKCGCLSLDVRPALSKAASKGKSVRTVRQLEALPEINNHRDSKSVPAEQKPEETETLSIENGGESNAEKSQMVVIKIGISEKRSKSTGGKRKKQGNVGTSIILGVRTKDSSSGKAAVLSDVLEDEPDSEIDKKADEFIAKFKEQQRLQKLTAEAELSSRKHPQQKPLYQS